MVPPRPSVAPARGAVELTPERAAVMHSAMVFSAGFQRLVNHVGTDGLNYPRLRLLELLHCRGPHMMRELADELGLSPRNVTAAVDALEADALVRRTAHPSDRRATLVELTDEGFHAAEQELAPRLVAISDLFSELTKTEQRQLTALLDRLAVALRQSRPQE
jgi:DNA-binding MarR family transcriptional regulator